MIRTFSRNYHRRNVRQTLIRDGYPEYANNLTYLNTKNSDKANAENGRQHRVDFSKMEVVLKSSSCIYSNFFERSAVPLQLLLLLLLVLARLWLSLQG